MFVRLRLMRLKSRRQGLQLTLGADVIAFE